MKQKDFYDLLDKAQKYKPVLPKGVSCKKTLLSNGRWGYIFRHTELGQLGRILILPHEGRQSQIVCEVSGEADDPMTIKRQEILAPITKDAIDRMTLVCGDGTGALSPYVSPKETHCVRSIAHSCESCKKIVALLVFADNANDAGELEDYARMMHKKIAELQVPTWIIGEESEHIVNGDDLRKSLVLTLHDNRDVKIKTPDDVMDEVDRLINTHCA